MIILNLFFLAVCFFISFFILGFIAQFFEEHYSTHGDMIAVIWLIFTVGVGLDIYKFLGGAWF